jgi:hypothetical protein
MPPKLQRQPHTTSNGPCFGAAGGGFGRLIPQAWDGSHRWRGWAWPGSGLRGLVQRMTMVQGQARGALHAWQRGWPRGRGGALEGVGERMQGLQGRSLKRGAHGVQVLQMVCKPRRAAAVGREGMRRARRAAGRALARRRACPRAFPAAAETNVPAPGCGAHPWAGVQHTRRANGGVGLGRAPTSVCHCFGASGIQVPEPVRPQRPGRSTRGRGPERPLHQGPGAPRLVLSAFSFQKDDSGREGRA